MEFALTPVKEDSDFTLTPVMEDDEFELTPVVAVGDDDFDLKPVETAETASADLPYMAESFADEPDWEAVKVRLQKEGKTTGRVGAAETPVAYTSGYGQESPLAALKPSPYLQDLTEKRVQLIRGYDEAKSSFEAGKKGAEKEEGALFADLEPTQGKKPKETFWVKRTPIEFDTGYEPDQIKDVMVDTTVMDPEGNELKVQDKAETILKDINDSLTKYERIMECLAQ